MMTDLLPLGLFWLFVFLVLAFRLGVSLVRDLFRPSGRRLAGPGGKDLRHRRPAERPATENRDRRLAEHEIFRLASRLRGRLTVSDIVIPFGTRAGSCVPYYAKWAG